MEITLKLARIKKNGKDLLLYTLSPVYRIVMGIVLTIVLVAVLSSGAFSISGVLVVLVCFLALCYQEKWTFDAQEKTIIYQLGFIFLNKKRVITFNEIENYSINHFARGKLNQEELPPPEKMPLGSQTRLILNLKNEKPLLINTMSFSRRQRIVEEAEAIAEYSGLPLDFEN